jgi:oxalate---CoA ligase
MIRRLIRDQALRDGDAPAILAPGYATLSYAGLEQIVDRAGHALALLGLDRASRVALVCSNGADAGAAFLSIAAHAACAPLNPGYRAAEFELYLSDLRPQALVVEAGLDCAARGAAVSLGIPILELTRRASGVAGDVEIIGPVPRQARTVSVLESDDVALLLYTSGTTSRPKLVPLSQANLHSSAHHIAGALSLKPGDRCLNVMPLFHIHGLEAALLASIASGGSVVCCPGFIAPRFFEWAAEFRATWYTAVPTIHQSALARAKTNLDVIRTTSFRFIRSCSAALPSSVMEEMEAVFRVPVIEAYGMTEAAHQVATNPLPPGRRKSGSVGVAAGPEVAIMDDNGALLPPETDGEVVIRGSNVTRGYHQNQNANMASFTHGWFRTGDQGYLDREGYLFLKGRKKELINRGGEKLAPREIDEVLLRHPKIEQAAAFAVPHPSLGESVAAAIVPRKGQVITAREVRQFSARYLADFKVPERIHAVEDIPKGPTGKIQRIGLAARLGIGPGPDSQAVRREFVAPVSKREKEIANLFATTLGVARIGLHDDFFEQGGDSLLAAILLARIEELTGSAIPLFAFVDHPSVFGISNSLKNWPEQKPATGELSAAIRASQGEPILFCIPGSEGNIAGFFHLARWLGKDQPVTAFRQLAWEAGRSVADLAAHYVSEVLAAQTDGPYYLAGVCTGGLVAYEMASQLIGRGKSIGLLALIDCYNHAWAGKLPFVTKLSYRADLLRRRFIYQKETLQHRDARAGYMREKITAFSETTRQRCAETAYKLRTGLGLKPSLKSGPEVAMRLSAARYVPRVLPVKMELFRAEEPRVDGYDYPDMGWRGLAQKGVAVHTIPGGHRSMLAGPGARIVAERLQNCMQGSALPGLEQ